MHVAFGGTGLALRVPKGKVRAIGLRRLASPALIDEALAVAEGRPRQSKAMWARRAQEWQAKVDSGDPRRLCQRSRQT